MADSDEHPTRGRATVRIDKDTVLPLALVLLLVGGGIQYGRQSERLDRVVTELALVQQKLAELSIVISKLSPSTSAGR